MVSKPPGLESSTSFNDSYGTVASDPKDIKTGKPKNLRKELPALRISKEMPSEQGPESLSGKKITSLNGQTSQPSPPENKIPEDGLFEMES